MTTPRSRLSLIALVLVALPAPAAGAAKRPDLAVRDAGLLKPVLRAGGSSKVVVRVRNGGGARAGASTVRFYLSRDRRRSRGDRRLAGAARTAAIKAPKTATARGSLRLPRGTKARRYYVIACADDRSRVRESNERNNCARSPEPVGVQPGAREVRVTPVGAPGRAFATGVIGRGGGAVQASDAAGRVYSLVVPPEALAGQTKIGMQVLSAVGGLPFAGGLRAGVRLEPSGLEFARTAALVVRGPGIREEPGLAEFAYAKGGRGLHLQPRFRSVPAFAAPYVTPGNSLVLQVGHFSGVGIAPATTAEAASQLRRGALEARDRLAQDARDRLQKNDVPGLETEFTSYLEQVLLPEAAAASFSDTLYEAAVRDLMTWEKLRDVLGLPDEPTAKQRTLLAQVDKLLDAAFKELVKRAEQQCRSGNFGIVTKIIPLEKQRQLIGAYEGRPNELSEAFKRCFRFELRARSTLTLKGSGGDSSTGSTWDENYTLAGTVPLRLEQEGPGVVASELTGTSALPYTYVRKTESGDVSFGGIGSEHCDETWAGQTRAAQLTVEAGDIGLRLVAKRDEPITWTYGARPAVQFNLGDPQELVNVKCRGTSFGSPSSSNENEWQRNFLRWWRYARGSDRTSADFGGGGADEADAGPWVTTFDRGRHPVVGTFSLDRSEAQYGLRLVEKWELVHTPLPPR